MPVTANPPRSPVVFGEVLFDCFEDGSRVLGGAPFNVAWHLQAFGRSPLFVSRVGDDAMGREIRDTMLAWGMTTAGLQQDSRYATGEVRVTLSDGQPAFDIMTERAWDHIAPDVVPPVSAALVYHGSLGLRHEDSTAALDGLIGRLAAPVFIDVNLRPPWWDAEQLAARLDQARWVKVNDDELNTLVAGPGGAQAKAGSLMARHALGLLIVTCGAEGAFARDDQGIVTAVTPQVRETVVDTVGAGDAFAAVCLLGLLEDWPLGVTLERAQEFASVLVARRGATLDERSVYERLSNMWDLTGK